MFPSHPIYEAVPNPQPSFTGPLGFARSVRKEPAVSSRNLQRPQSNDGLSFPPPASDPDAEGPPPVFHEKGGKSHSKSKGPAWRTGARLAAATAATVLFVNVIASIAAAGRWGIGNGVASIYTGDCHKVETINTCVHLIINALSTALLSGSNYCMQCLSAPSRREVDKAHSKRRWLDIGIHSFRNLKTIKPKKVRLWWCLAWSSLPLHLMYNSAFFSSLSTNNYNVLIVTEDFLNGGPVGNTTAFDGYWTANGESIPHYAHSIQEEVRHYERLDKTRCMEAYMVDFVTNRGTLVIVTNHTSQGGASVVGGANYEYQAPGSIDYIYNPYYWMCNPPDTLSYINGSAATNLGAENGSRILEYNSSIETNLGNGFTGQTYGAILCYDTTGNVTSAAAKWQVNNFDVSYCMSENVPENCAFSINLAVMIIVIVCNLGKLIAMTYVAFGNLEDPLITIGDAVSSYLDSPDRTTNGMCAVDRRDFVIAAKHEKYIKIFGEGAANHHLGEEGWKSLRQPRKWEPSDDRWFSAASERRRWTCIALFLSTIAIMAALFHVAIPTLPRGQSIPALWDLGFGSVHAQMLIPGWTNPQSDTTAILTYILIANSPQAVLSGLYFTLNGLLTSMFLADEWSHFDKERKPLRVSQPRGRQRKTYFLQLPYRIALPLIAMSGLLHWLASQSIFLAIVAEYDELGNLINSAALTTCGFSPIAIVCALMAGVIIGSATFVLAFRRFKTTMPLVGSCSGAISAACHRPPWDTRASTMAVQWGALPGYSWDIGTFGTPGQTKVLPEMSDTGNSGYCAFTSGEVESLVKGNFYGGVRVPRPR